MVSLIGRTGGSHGTREKHGKIRGIPVDDDEPDQGHAGIVLL